MTKIYCADESCKYNNDKGICTKKEINLNWSSIVTVHDGRQEYNKCVAYEKSDTAIRIEEFVKEYFKIGEIK